MNPYIRRALPRVLLFWLAGLVVALVITVTGAPPFLIPLAALTLAVLILR